MKHKEVINEVMTATEAAKIWGKTEGAIRAAIKVNKFVHGIDYRKAGGITLITKSAMERVYGKLNKKKKEVIEMEKDLTSIYAEWRKITEDHNKQEEEIGGSIPVYGNVDCGEVSVREDFSNYAGLENTISFEEMLELEKEY